MARLRAKARLGRLRPGVTVVVVNWNTVDVTADVIRAVQRLSPPDTSVLLIDNGSSDGSRERFASWPGIRTLFLPSNAGHGVALDLGVCLAGTRLTVTLDSDAIPLRPGWMEPVIGLLRDGSAVLAGLRSSRGFVHPVFLAVDTATFVRRSLSFQVHREHVDGAPDNWGVDAWDTGELLSRSLGPTMVHLVSPTPNQADGLPGMTTAGVVYHHGGVSRDGDGAVSQVALQSWRSACRVLGLSEVITPVE